MFRRAVLLLLSWSLVACAAASPTPVITPSAVAPSSTTSPTPSPLVLAVDDLQREAFGPLQMDHATLVADIEGRGLTVDFVGDSGGEIATTLTAGTGKGMVQVIGDPVVQFAMSGAVTDAQSLLTMVDAYLPKEAAAWVHRTIPTLRGTGEEFGTFGIVDLALKGDRGMSLDLITLFPVCDRSGLRETSLREVGARSIPGSIPSWRVWRASQTRAVGRTRGLHELLDGRARARRVDRHGS